MIGADTTEELSPWVAAAGRPRRRRFADRGDEHGVLRAAGAGTAPAVGDFAQSEGSLPARPRQRTPATAKRELDRRDVHSYSPVSDPAGATSAPPAVRPAPSWPARSLSPKPGSVAGVPSVRAIAYRYRNARNICPNCRISQRIPPPRCRLRAVFKVKVPSRRCYAEAGESEDLSLAEVYDPITALELDWYEHLGLPPQGEAGHLLPAARPPSAARFDQPRAGVFGEAIPPGDARVLRATWQLRRSGHRPAGGGRQGRRHRQPGPVRARLVDRRAPPGSRAGAKSRHFRI